MRATWRRQPLAFAAWLALANAFLLPLHLGGVYGPFTEGGGDVAIYADVAKYAVDHHLPAWGPQAALTNLARLGGRLGVPSVPDWEARTAPPTCSW